MKYGMKSVTMDDICRHLGISKKTLYEYVSDKEELIEKAISNSIDKHTKCCKEICSRGLNAIDELLEISKYLSHISEQKNPVCDYDMQKYYPAIHVRTHEFIRTFSYNLIFNNLIKGKADGSQVSKIVKELLIK